MEIFMNANTGTATSTNTESATNTSCTVTNNITLPASPAPAQTAWNGSIVAINAYNAGSGTAQGYAQTLEALPFASGNTLAINSSSAITLNQAGTLIYNIIFAQSNNLFPVSVVGEMLNFSTNSYPPISISSSTTPPPSAYINAFLFYQEINAFPSSDLAKDFATALTGATNANSASDIDTGIAGFFAKTKGFTDVTYDTYLAVSSYLNTFAFAWANFATSYTYYLFSSSTTGNSNATLLGTVAFTQNSSSGTPSLTDFNGGYTITYTDTNSNTTTLSFSSGQLVSSLTDDVPAIALQCTYTQLSQITGNSSDTQIVPSLIGSLNGAQAVGVYTEEGNTPGFWQSVENFFQSPAMQIVSQVFGDIMGLKALVDLVGDFKGALQKAQASNKGEKPTDEQVSDAKANLNASKTEAVNNQQELANKLGPENDVKIDPDLNISQDQANVQKNEEVDQVKDEVQTEKNVLNEQEQVLEQEASLGVNQQVENVASDEQSENTELNNVDASNPEAAQKTIDQVSTQASTDGTQLDTLAKTEGASLSKSALETIDEANEAEEEDQEEEKQQEENESNTEEGNAEDLDEDI